MRTTHRRTWKKGTWLITDERTGAIHYADEMVREPDTGLIVHKDSVDPRHPQLRIRPKYNDPQPVNPTIPDDIHILTEADLMLSGYVGETEIQRCPSPADHIFNTGIDEMIIDGAGGVGAKPCPNEFTDFEVDTTARSLFPSGPDFPPQ